MDEQHRKSITDVWEGNHISNGFKRSPLDDPLFHINWCMTTKSSGRQLSFQKMASSQSNLLNVLTYTHNGHGPTATAPCYPYAKIEYTMLVAIGHMLRWVPPPSPSSTACQTDTTWRFSHVVVKIANYFNVPSRDSTIMKSIRTFTLQ